MTLSDFYKSIFYRLSIYNIIVDTNMTPTKLPIEYKLILKLYDIQRLFN